MLAAFVADLRSTPIVTYQNVTVIRNYIADKYPGLSLEKSTLMLADAVRQIVDQKIRAISEKYRAAIRENLFRNVARRTGFQINAADVLEASLPLGWAGEDLAAEVCCWIHQTIKKMVPLEMLHGFYHQLSDRYAKDPGRNLEVLAARIDQAGLLKERAAACREERLRQRRIVLSQLEKEANNKPREDEELVAEPAAALEKEPSFDTAVPKPAPVPSPKRAGYLSRRITVFTTAGMMVILALFMINLVRESVKETENAVLASSGIRRPAKHFESSYAAIADTANETGVASPTGTDIQVTGNQQTETVGAVDPGDVGRSDAEIGPINENAAQEFLVDATAYDLSSESCGKTREHPLYGITRSGVKASAGRTIAVDPEIIPLGSKVYITFPENYSYLDGIYIAEDTGRLIKGRRIDLFLGEDLPGERNVYQDALKFGVQKVKLEILENPQ